MAPKMTLLQVDPETQLEFPKAPYTTASRRLILTNVSSGFVAFKVKTTAPKCYLVRPSSGVLAAQKSVDIQIILQPQSMDASDPSPNHRFLVQAVMVDSDRPPSREGWGNFTKDELQDQRLNVVFTDDGGTGPAVGNDASAHEKAIVYASAQSESGRAAGRNVEMKKYEEMKDYCMALEKSKTTLDIQISNLQHQVRTATAPAKGAGFQFWHVALVAIFSFVFAYMMFAR